MQTNSIMRRIRNRRGLNLIELAIVMAVVGLIVGGIYIAASSVYRNVRESQTQDDVLQIVQNLKSTYGAQGGVAAGTALTYANISGAGIVPPDMVNQAQTGWQDAFGGAVTLAALANNVVRINLATIPGTVCSDLLVKQSAVGTSGALNSGLQEIITAPAGGGGGPILNTAFPISPATAAAACGTTTATVEFEYSVL